MPILRGSTPILGTQDLPGRFKEWKDYLVVIGQTAHKLETNAHANSPMAEKLAYQCMEMVGETCPRRYFCGSLWLSGTTLRQIQAPR